MSIMIKLLRNMLTFPQGTIFIKKYKRSPSAVRARRGRSRTAATSKMEHSVIMVNN